MCGARAEAETILVHNSSLHEILVWPNGISQPGSWRRTKKSGRIKPMFEGGGWPYVGVLPLKRFQHCYIMVD